MKRMIMITMALLSVAYFAANPDILIAKPGTAILGEPTVTTQESAPEMQPLAAAIPYARALAAYDKVLRDHVDTRGFVDYPAIVANPKFLDLYIDALADESLLEGKSRDEQLATLINAYNAFTLKLIAENYRTADGGTLGSITDLYQGKPWDQNLWNLAGETVSLNQLEHEMIRPVFDEPRIHWAVVCAAHSCPPLRAEAYTAKQLEAQLADQEAYVLNFEQPRYVQKKGGQVLVTKIFEWYGQDFSPNWKTYVSRYLNLPADQGFGFVPYNWKLNAQ